MRRRWIRRYYAEHDMRAAEGLLIELGRLRICFEWRTKR